MLPDGMLVADIYSEFMEVIECFERSACDAYMFLSALSELSERQWHTYELLHDGLRKKIEKLLVSLWDGRDLVIVENDSRGCSVRIARSICVYMLSKGWQLVPGGNLRDKVCHF